MSVENEQNGLGADNSVQPSTYVSNMNVDVNFGPDDYSDGDFEPLILDDVTHSAPVQTNQNNPSNLGDPNKSIEDEDAAIDFLNTPENEISEGEKPDPENLELTVDEKLIEKLKEQGYEVKKQEEVDPMDQLSQERGRINGVLQQIQGAIDSPDETLILSKMRNDLADTFKKEGRENQIDSLDFNEELQAQLDDMNPMMRKLFADNIREKLVNAKILNQNKLNEVVNEEKSKIDAVVNKNLSELNQSLNDIYKEKTFLGVQLSEQDMRDTYSLVTSKKLNEQLGASQRTIAEVALFLKFRDQIVGNVNGGTFGQGVKQTVDAIVKGQTSGTKSPISNIIEKSERASGSEGVKSFDEYWAQEQFDIEKDDKPKIVAGSVRR